MAWVLRHPIQAIDSRRIGIDFIGPKFTLVLLGILVVPISYGTRVTWRALDHGRGRPLPETIALVAAGLALAVMGVYLTGLAFVLIAKQLTATPQQGRHDQEEHSP